MRRITMDHINAVVDLINEVTQSPDTPWTDGTANIGNYHVSQAYGGYSLHRISNEGGGVRDVFSCGHIPKRDLHDRMWAFHAGFCDSADNFASLPIAAQLAKLA